jgi:hypothetical protein
MDRPAWFGEVVFAAINELCVANQITVNITNAGGNPCVAPTPSPSPAATPKAGKTSTPKPTAKPAVATAKPAVATAKPAEATPTPAAASGGATAKPASTSGVKAVATGTPSTGAASGWMTIGAVLLIAGTALLAAGVRRRRIDI